MPGPSPIRPAWQRWIIRHLFLYLALIAGVSVVVSALFAREEVLRSFRAIGAGTAILVLALSVLNYVTRFAKWDRLLSDSGIRIDRASSAGIYFSCLAMVVTPARLGELYKLVFLRRLHGIGATRSLPPLVLERATDVLAILALCAAQPFSGPGRVLGVVLATALFVVMGAALALPATRRPLLAVSARLPYLRSRSDRIDELLDGHARLLAPRSFALSLSLSVLAWWAECVGLWLICQALAGLPGLGDSTWVYAASTLLGNLTFLPGGLGGTEVALKTLLEGLSMDGGAALAATLIVRAATLWFAVAIGLAVTVAARRHLHWSEVRDEAAAGD